MGRNKILYVESWMTGWRSYCIFLCKKCISGYLVICSGKRNRVSVKVSHCYKSESWELATVNVRLDSSYGGMHVCVLSRVWLFETPWTVARQTLLSMEFSQQEYWSGLPFLPLGDLPDPGIKLASPVSPALHADSLPSEPPGLPKYSTNIC